MLTACSLNGSTARYKLGGYYLLYLFLDHSVQLKFWWFSHNNFRQFPRLEEGGGFEILRTADQSRSDLTIACVGACTVDEMMQISTGRVYLRPIQKSIVLDTSKKTLVSEEMEECLDCGVLVNIDQLRHHIKECRVNPYFLHYCFYTCLFKLL